MESFLYILLGILICATAVFIYYVVLSSRLIETGNAKLLGEFQQANQSIAKVDAGVKDLKGSIEQSIIPNLQAVYHRIEADLFDLRGGKLTDLLTRAGIEMSFPLSEDQSIVGFGIQDDPLKVNYMLTYDSQSHDLIIRTASAVIAPPSHEVLRELMALNYSIKTGTLGLAHSGNSYVISVDYTWHLPSSHVSPEALGNILYRLFGVHQHVLEIYEKRQIHFTIILLPDYVKFLIDAASVDNDEEE